MAGSNLKFAVIAYDESGTATTLLSRDQSVSNTICSLAITAPKASYYDFIISPTRIAANANAIRILVSNNEPTAFRYDAAGTLQAKGMDFYDSLKDAETGDTLVLTADITRGAATAGFGGTSLTIKSNTNATRTISNLWDGQQSLRLTAAGTTLNLENVKFYGSDAPSSNGPAIYSDGPMTINGSNAEFSNYRLAGGDRSSVLFSSGDFTISGENTFENNSSEGIGYGWGVAIQSRGSVFISGRNRFENNGFVSLSNGDVIGSGIMSHMAVIVSGQNDFVGNYAEGGSGTVGGAALYSNQGATISGQNNFIDNWTTGNGGAMRFNGGTVSFQGNGSAARFENNQIGTRGTASLNDIYFNGTGAVVCQDLGSVYFGGGMAKTSLKLSGNVRTEFGFGSQTSITNLTLEAGSRLTIDLGTKTFANLQTGAATTSAATAFALSGAITDDGSNYVKFRSEAFTGTKQAITGPAAGLSSVTSVELPTGTNGYAYVSAADASGVTLTRVETADKPAVLVRNKAAAGSGDSINDLGTIQTKDSIILTGDVNHTGQVGFSGGVLAIASSTADQRTITNTGSAAPLKFSAATTLYLDNLKFVGKGEANKLSGHGGAINGAALTILGENVTFTDNWISGNSEGGALFSSGNMVLSGSFTFDNNGAANQSGGAISVNLGTIAVAGTNVFTNNSAYYAGGAIYARNGVTLTGDNTFTGNKSTNDYSGGAIKTTSIVLEGSNTFTGNSATNSSGRIGGAIRASNDDGTQGSVTFQGDGSSAKFTGNTFNNNPNDIYTGGTVMFKGMGNYWLDGGIVANEVKIESGAYVAFDDQAVNQTANANSAPTNGLGFSVDNATLAFEGTQTHNGAIDLKNGAALEIGTDGLGGALTLTALPTADASSMIHLDVFAVDNYDSLNFASAADLSGLRISLDFSDLFVPKNNTSLDLITGDSLTGIDEDLFTVVNFPQNYSYDFAINDDNVAFIMNANGPVGVPEPSTWALLLLGVFGIAYLRKR